ncbi:hypothetical protein P2G88_01860 [Aliiglaciecola sp. CAU 1673]|uniref:DUF6998 domain-containing protein n=1 Tax=Aliiglaciecola sp. CAU 1673 TaxID=3032595 RepID=UPI0023DCC7BB|nr:hypothetical protein [Aliiglaciecola sp. CAU 1673]MDF2176998.1 hypothetical protein [Aliiglaciecola sp. CAU 1673]
MQIDHDKLKELIRQLYDIVQRLHEMTGRHFTPDGHMVGSLGEVLVADLYGLDLMTASNAGFDAISPCGKEVEIKCTQSTSVAFRYDGVKTAPESVIVIKLHKDGSFDEIYNGSGERIWKILEGRKIPDNGQLSVSLNQLIKLQAEVSPSEKISKKF